MKPISKTMMKKLFFMLLAIIPSMVTSAQDFTVATFNIRNHNKGDYKTYDGWDQRKQAMCSLLNYESPDFFGCQEVKLDQINDMLALMPEYAYIGVAREDGKQEGEYTPIFYKKDRLELLKSGNFWLSETPDVPSKGWDAMYKRVCTWAYFKDKVTKRRFYYFNTHFDHIGTTARLESAKLIMQKMKEFAKTNEPVFLTADFNVDQFTDSYAILANSDLLKDCYTSAKFRFAPNGSYNDFNTELYTDRRIDHIFVSKKVNVERYAILNDTDWRAGADGNKVRHALSDHYPVFAKVSF